MQKAMIDLGQQLINYQPLANGNIDWGYVKEILLGIVGLLKIVAERLPESLGWLGHILDMAANIIAQVINSLPDNDGE